MQDRTAQRQALAEKIRADHLQATKRGRTVTMMMLVVFGAVAIVVLLVWAQMSQNSEEHDALEAPQHATDDYGFMLTPELATEGAVTTQAPTTVALYEDFLCPSCKVFHEESSEFLAEEVTAGRINLVYHPFTFLLAGSTNEYTQRAANAAACVADEAGPAGYATMHDLLMANQPAQGTPGHSDEALLEFAAEAGASDVAECVNDRRFEPWIEAALQAGQRAGVTETPTVRIGGLNVVRSENGREVMPGPEEIQYALEMFQ